MENSSRSFSILYQDLQYLGAIKTSDPGSHQNSGSGVLGTWEPSKLWIRSLEYLGATKSTVISKLLSRIVSLRTYFLVIMENSSRSLSILYSDLQYLGAIKTPDLGFGYLGVTKTQDLEFGYLGATKSTVISKLLSRIVS